MNKNKLGEFLTEYLIREGITQRKFAEMIGVTESAVSRYISGVRVPNGTIMVKIMQTTGFGL